MTEKLIDYGQPPLAGWAPMVAELYVENINISLAFWCDVMGFSIAYQRPEESFAYLERSGGAQMMLYQPPENEGVDHSVKLPQRIVLQLFVDSLSPVLAKIEKHSHAVLQEPQEVWRRWGDRMGGKREIRIKDPDGHVILVAEDIGERPLDP